MLTDTTWYTRLLASVGVLLSVVGGCANLLLLYVLLSRRLPPWQDKHTTKRRLSPLEVHLLNITVLETLVALVLIPLVIISTLVTVGWGVKVDKDVVMGHVVSAEYKAMKQWTMIVCHLPIGMRILTDMVRCLLLEAFSVERYVVVTMGVFPHQWIVRLGMAVAWVLGAVLMVSQVSHGDTLMTIHLCHHTYSDLKDIQDKEAVGKICSILRLVVVLQAVVIVAVMALLTMYHLYKHGQLQENLSAACCCRQRTNRGMYAIRQSDANVPVHAHITGNSQFHARLSSYWTWATVHNRSLPIHLHFHYTEADERRRAEAQLTWPVILYTIFTLTLVTTIHVVVLLLQKSSPNPHLVDSVTPVRLLPCVAFPFFTMTAIPCVRTDVLLLIYRVVRLPCALNRATISPCSTVQLPGLTC